MREPQFHRIRRLPPYVFSEVNAMKARARAAGKDVIDFGMGNPDQPASNAVVDKLIETIKDPKTHRYSTSRGIPGLRRAQAAYYERRFGVALDPETEIIATLGSKEGLANLAQAITAPGDVILAPNPSYPIHAYGFIIAGASIRHVPMTPKTDLLAELAHAVQHSVPTPTAMVLNFPSNPTALTVGLDFYKEVVSFARNMRSSFSQISPMPKFISTIRRLRSLRWTAQKTLPSSSPRSARLTTCLAGAWVSQQATRC